MTRGGDGSQRVSAAHRLLAVLPPDAGVPLYGLSLAGPAAFADGSSAPPVLPNGLMQALAAFAAGWHDPEPRAVATQFSKYWFRAALPPTVVCAAAGLEAPASAPGRMRLETDRTGIPHLLVPDDPAIAHAPTAGEAVLERLFAIHLDPVVALLARKSGLAPRVFWSNVANVLAWYLDQLRDLPATGVGATALAARWSDPTTHPRFPGRNPLQMPRDAPTATGQGPGARRRRICCARYLSADCGLCAGCPLESAPAARTAKR